MALPQQINPATPGATDQISLGDDQIRGLKLALVDILGLPSATNITNAAFAMSASGLADSFYQDTGVNPTVNGQLRRNGTNLFYHDGTSARKVITSGTGAIALAGLLSSTGGADYTTSSPGFVDVDVATLKANITIPSNARFLITYAIVSVLATTSSFTGNLVRVLAAANEVASGCYGTLGNQVGFNGFNAFTILGVFPNPGAGAATIALQFRNTAGITMFNPATETDGKQRPKFLYLVTY